jgi:hypothetical protein
MPNIISPLAIFTVFLSTAIFAATTEDKSTEAQLIEAITCQHDSPVDLIREIASKKTTALKIQNNNEDGFDEKIIIKTKKPLYLHGASSHAVNLDFNNNIKNFNGIVYSVFKGNPQKAIKAFNLTKDDSATRIGDYTSTQKTTGCPATIGITVIDKTTFALGCGWCNGD